MSEHKKQVVWTSPTDPRARIVRVASNHFEFQHMYDTPSGPIWCREVIRDPDDSPSEISHPDVFDEIVLAALRAPPPEPAEPRGGKEPKT